VVAVGAAVQAGMIAGEVNDILLLDVTPLSLGLETIGGVMKPLIPRNTTIPVRRSDVFSTAENNQSQVEVHILQGERQLAEHNKSLGRFQLRGIPPAPRGIPQVQVSFDIDANGILQVTALDKYTGREQSITVQGATNLSEAEINRMIREANEFADSDRRRRERVDKRNRSQDLIAQCDRRLREVNLDFGPQFASSLRREVEVLSRELQASLAEDDDREIDLCYANLQDALYELTREVDQSLDGYDEDEEDLFNLPSMSSIKDAVSKGVDALRGTSSGGSTRRATASPRYGDRPRDNGSWDDWDDDAW
ncbi:MAG TPA: Hsp70 family protein, partial [Stenomitos sp.]